MHVLSYIFSKWNHITNGISPHLIHGIGFSRKGGEQTKFLIAAEKRSWATLRMTDVKNLI